MHYPKPRKIYPAWPSRPCLIVSMALVAGACSTPATVEPEFSTQPEFNNQPEQSTQSEQSVQPEQSAQPDAVIVAPPEASVTSKTMALDIARSVSQLFSPVNTTLQFNNSHNDPLLEYFIALFSKAGFGIQRVSADQGSEYFSYTLVEDRMANGNPLVRFDTSIGAIKVGRDYTPSSANSISPASPVRIAGTRAVVRVDDTANGRFKPGSADMSKAIYTASLDIEGSAPNPLISLITDDLVEQLVQGDNEGISLQSLNSNRVEVRNVFHTRQSNFASILDDYESVDRLSVVFGNDSLVLGDTNKLLIEQFVNRRVKAGDLISLLGCSNGHTDLDIGNEGLAMGRARRMTEALLAQGVARNRILEEGCWAPESAGDETPARGVVLELWRKT